MYEATAIALLQAEAKKLVWCWQVDGKPIMQTASWYLLQADACTKQLHVALPQTGSEKLVWCWQVDGKPIMQTVWPQGSSSNFWQWTDLAQQYSDMWSGTPFQNGSTHLSISGQTQQISISSIVNAPFEVISSAHLQFQH